MSGWHRLGIVASIIWMIGAGGYEHNWRATKERDARQADYSFYSAYCYEEKAKRPDDPVTKARNCGDEAWEAWNAPRHDDPWWHAWANAALKLLAIWIVVLATICTVQWVYAGFRPQAKRKGGTT